MSNTPPKRSETRKNAFALLMTSSSGATKKSPPSRKGKGGSNFVLCENCNKSFIFTNIIHHREQCIMQDMTTTRGGNAEGQSNTIIHGVITEKNGVCCESQSTKGETKESSNDAKACRDLHDINGATYHDSGASVNYRKRQLDGSPDLGVGVGVGAFNAKDIETTTCSSHRNPTTSPLKQNAFTQMLNSSKKMFAEKEVQKQRFHLSEVDGTLDLQWISDENDAIPSNVEWTGKLMIRAPKDATDNEQEIELSVTSSIKSEPEFVRAHYVERHSRFSVPVLKSILQKSIRRRRPKPSVRLAMELADKSFGELIRRLPIICLEDSFLHHEFPFLVWLMIAYSKNYVPPKRLVDKVMQIVFEIASCPWQDACNSSNEGVLASINLASLVQNDSFHTNDTDYCKLILRSMMLRKKFGGMACDMRMMDQFMDLWSQRYHNRQVEVLVLQTFQQRFPQLSDDVYWKDVSALVHSLNSVADIALLQSGFLKLELNDISPSGIDFHCSNVLDVLMDRTCMFYNKLIALIGSKQDAEIELIVKKMMWDYSSGTNNRRKILGKNMSSTPEGDEQMKKLWDQEAVPLVKKFTDAYIASRLG